MMLSITEIAIHLSKKLDFDEKELRAWLVTQRDKGRMITSKFRGRVALFSHAEVAKVMVSKELNVLGLDGTKLCQILRLLETTDLDGQTLNAFEGVCAAITIGHPDIHFAIKDQDGQLIGEYQDEPNAVISKFEIRLNLTEICGPILRALKESE